MPLNKLSFSRYNVMTKRANPGLVWVLPVRPGPGDVGYAVKEFTRPEGATVTFVVNLYRRGGGTPVFDASMVLHHRCARFNVSAEALRAQFHKPGNQRK